MATPPASTKTSLQQRLSGRAREHWPQLAGVEVRFRAQFAYVSGVLADDTTLPLMRCATADRPPGGASQSTWQARTATRTLTCPPATPPGHPKREALDVAWALYLND
jgi:hypothetical protein